ncbi:hypothetical protein [Protofrankia symbiont of Coriaria ruscifolia]|uniref:Uncharacterized protein n=1 Tax=Candidatus Protofrankia californiensis TaxID=1839754 RepID=A0A1C3PBY2_9ACTN|nr:hypothetical protein [Protofrankia symbiont of Coriaria ruscifolia]SBW27333.1 hypothetical protein FDG2_5280 [Candidatus Protofrankia californiensis]
MSGLPVWAPFVLAVLAASGDPVVSRDQVDEAAVYGLPTYPYRMAPDTRSA